MGYSHYVSLKRPLTLSEWEHFEKSVLKITEWIEQNNSHLGRILFKDGNIYVEGKYEEETCEPLIFEKEKVIGNVPQEPIPFTQGHLTMFIKTRRLPYDTIVLVVLFTMCECVPNVVNIKSDAQEIEEVTDGINVYNCIFETSDTVVNVANKMIS